VSSRLLQGMAELPRTNIYQADVYGNRTSELVPVKKRGMYIGIIVCFLAPMTPYVLYSQLLSTRTSQGWRWCLWIAL
jgi:hypothetical protein